MAVSARGQVEARINHNQSDSSSPQMPRHHLVRIQTPKPLTLYHRGRAPRTKGIGIAAFQNAKVAAIEAHWQPARHAPIARCHRAPGRPPSRDSWVRTGREGAAGAAARESGAGVVSRHDIVATAAPWRWGTPTSVDHRVTYVKVEVSLARGAEGNPPLDFRLLECLPVAVSGCIPERPRSSRCH